MNKVLFFTFFIFNVSYASACSIAAKGTFWTHDQLIDQTETILLVTPVSEKNNSKFRVIEVLKGEKTAALKWRRFRSKEKHVSLDFDAHREKSFWKEGDKKPIRSMFYAGNCTPQFTFALGENYLIFKESPGHPHSAEIIKSENDLWYKYVKNRINHNKENHKSTNPSG